MDVALYRAAQLTRHIEEEDAQTYIRNALAKAQFQDNIVKLKVVAKHEHRMRITQMNDESLAWRHRVQ